MIAVVLALVLGGASSAVAPTSLPANADVVVEVELGEVDLQVEGWAKSKVEVDEQIKGGWTAHLEEDGGRVHVRIDGPPGIPSSGTIKLRVPKGAELQVTARGGDVRGANLHGRATVASISGDIAIGGPATQIEIATTTGAVQVDGASGRVDVATISGKVGLAGVKGEIHVETVSGKIDITKARLERLQVETVSGAVEFAGELRKGPHAIATHSGKVKVAVPRTVPLRIVVSTFSGRITDAFGDPPGRHDDEHRRELGKGGGTLEITTFSGDILLRPPGS
jgi:DUF4097 and DUF4098 domain-containing protein YvlB